MEYWLSFLSPLLHYSITPGSAPVNDVSISIDGTFSKADDLFWTRVNGSIVLPAANRAEMFVSHQGGDKFLNSPLASRGYALRQRFV